MKRNKFFALFSRGDSNEGLSKNSRSVSTPELKPSTSVLKLGTVSSEDIPDDAVLNQRFEKVLVLVLA